MDGTRLDRDVGSVARLWTSTSSTATLELVIEKTISWLTSGDDAIGDDFACMLGCFFLRLAPGQQ